MIFSKNLSIGSNPFFPMMNQPGSSRERENLNLWTELLSNNTTLDELEIETMQIKIFKPYFISNKTIAEFYNIQKKNERKIEKLSILEILKTHLKGRKQFSRFFFTLDLNDDTFLEDLIVRNQQ